jgi:hypothetical protein
MSTTRLLTITALTLLVAAATCGGGAATGPATGHAGMMGGGAGTAGPTGAAGSAGMSGAAGMPPMTGAAGTKPPKGMMGMMGAAGAPVVNCTPGVKETLVTGCGYPGAAGSPLAMVDFNESEVLRAIEPDGNAPSGIVRMFYNDEHALTLGVRSVVVKTAAGSTTTDFPVTALAANPGSAVSPKTGTNELVGDNSGLDQSLRPMWPALYLTDITSNAQSRAGDWQQGGVPVNPNAVFGTWKAAVRTVDKTVTPAKVTITPDADPAKNNWSLADGDAAPAGLANEGYGAEARWNVTLTPGHSYRLQVIVHDGDQNKVGGDSGEACVLFCAGGGVPSGEAGSGGSDYPPPAMCPSGYMACSGGGIEPASCPSGTVCANGCCLPIVQ